MDHLRCKGFIEAFQEMHRRLANIVFFVVSEHVSCGSVDIRSSRNASLRYFATARI